MRLVKALILLIGIFLVSYFFIYDGELFQSIQYSMIMWVIVLMIKK
ncbi:hypothetical protein JOD29_003178 [Lysinibacillus composti]|nr:hypothetical protein [Lysinibacillus composti]MBM7609902.1 hypothetical protein [Lysinibacillus composti]